jgi:hypothetical protein
MKKLKLFLLLLLLSIYFLPLSAIAQSAGGQSAGGQTAGGTPTTVSLPNPLTGTNSSDSIQVFLGKVISYAMGIIGSLALVMFIYGGITWMLSRGAPEQVTKGQQIIIWATLGIAIIFASYALVRFVITAISGAT